MIRVAISVEGDTEEEFVKRALAAHLKPMGVEPVPYLLIGNVTVPRLGGEMGRLTGEHDAVTSLVDFYGFLGRRNRETVTELEARISVAVDANIRITRERRQIFPYVQQYEFEGLLFSDVEAFADLLNLPSGALEKLRRIRAQFVTPEDINDSMVTAPSKRIAETIPRYNKKVHGPLLAEEIGLDKIRAECPRFNRWLERMEALSSPT